MKKLFISIFISSFILTGCTAGQMSQAKIQTSQFDGSKIISAREMPALAHSKWHPSNVFFGARWTDKAPDLLVLKVKFMHDYQNLNKLDFNVDGDFFSAKRLDGMTDLERNEYYKASNAPYVITVQQANKILNSKNTMFKLTTLSGQYVEGAIVLNGDKSLSYNSINSVIQQISK